MLFLYFLYKENFQKEKEKNIRLDTDLWAFNTTVNVIKVNSLTMKMLSNIDYLIFAA